VNAPADDPAVLASLVVDRTGVALPPVVASPVVVGAVGSSSPSAGSDDRCADRPCGDLPARQCLNRPTLEYGPVPPSFPPGRRG
jgi:hypothetical protein